MTRSAIYARMSTDKQSEERLDRLLAALLVAALRERIRSKGR